MDDLVEQNDIAREIQEIMGNPVGFNVDEDEVRCTNMSHIA